MMQHQRTKIISLAHISFGFVLVHAFSLAHFPKGFAILNPFFFLIIIGRIYNGNIDFDTEFFHLFFDEFFLTQQNRLCNSFFIKNLCSFQNVVFFGISEGNSFWVRSCAVLHHSDEFFITTHSIEQLIFVIIKIFNGFSGNSTFHCSFCNRHGHFSNQSIIKRFWDKIFSAEI